MSSSDPRRRGSMLFRASLQRRADGRYALALPRTSVQRLGTRAQVMVTVDFVGVTWETVALPNGAGGHFGYVNKRRREKLGLRGGTGRSETHASPAPNSGHSSAGSGSAPAAARGRSHLVEGAYPVPGSRRRDVDRTREACCNTRAPHRRRASARSPRLSGSRTILSDGRGSRWQIATASLTTTGLLSAM